MRVLRGPFFPSWNANPPDPVKEPERLARASPAERRCRLVRGASCRAGARGRASGRTQVCWLCARARPGSCSPYHAGRRAASIRPPLPVCFRSSFQTVLGQGPVIQCAVPATARPLPRGETLRSPGWARWRSPTPRLPPAASPAPTCGPCTRIVGLGVVRGLVRSLCLLHGQPLA